MSGLGNADLSADAEEPLAALDVEIDGDAIGLDPSKTVLEVEMPDGSIVINLGGVKPVEIDSKFEDNLAEKLGDGELGLIADELLRGIEADEQSRAEWLNTRAEGIKLLGLVLETPSSGAAAGSAPLEGMSRVRHPILLEAVLAFQANAMAELLPADGPVKIRNDDPNSGPVMDQLATALQRDFNHYLTNDAPEYYPDTDRMLFWVGFGGCAFKKVYHDPLRRRPVSESVDAVDIIVSNAATDLQSAPRVTHRFTMAPSMLKRMQIIGAYRDVVLQDPVQQTKNAVDLAKEEVSGVTGNESSEPKDNNYEMFEVYCELDIPGFEHKGKNGEADGLAVPYKVTIEKNSRQVLEIRRNYDKDDDLCMPKHCIVKYPFVPGIGFYDIGLVHILGNTANAATAGWREGLDAGMFANFPGFLFAKGTGRQNTSEFRVAPGSGVPIDTNGMPISQSVMPLPYKEMGPAMMALITSIVETGQRVGGTATIAVGEGKQDAPVGTTIALIEQATKLQGAVHKRLHKAQASEFELLVQRFREDPEALWRNNRRSSLPRDKEQVLEALSNYDLVPAADPNTASSLQRIGKAQAVYQIAKDNPEKFNQDAVYNYTFAALGVGSAQPFFAAPQAKGVDPKVAAETMQAQAKLLDAQSQVSEIGLRARTSAQDDENRDLDRQTDEKVAAMGLAKAAIEKGTGSEAQSVLQGLQSASMTTPQ